MFSRCIAEVFSFPDYVLLIRFACVVWYKERVSPDADNFVF